MKFVFCSFFSFVLCVVSAADCWAHGFSIRFDDDGRILSYVSGAASDRFEHLIGGLPVTPNPSLLTSHHGLFNWNDGNPLPGNSFGAGDTFAIEMLGPLYYSDGGAAIAAFSGITLEGWHDNAPSVNHKLRIDGAGVLEVDTGGGWNAGSGFAVAGNDTHAMDWALISTLPGGIPDGVYGFSYQIQGWDENGDAYDPTNVVVLFHTPGFDAHALLAEAQDAVYAAAFVALDNGGDGGANGVPEPSAWALMGLSCVGVGGMVWRRRRRQR